MTDAVATEPGRRARRAALRDFKRQAILDAARTVLAAAGPAGATVRAIAAEAGYAPGSLYLHYGSKESIYADLFADSLADLSRALRAAGGDIRRVLRTPFDHYRAYPAALDLALAVFQGANGGDSAGERRLNGRLIGVLRALAEALQGSGMAPDDANPAAVGLVCHQLGVLAMDRTGRLAVLGLEAETLVERHISGLLDADR